MIQRIKDWRHERYIARLSRQCRRALDRNDRIKGLLYWDLMISAIRRRSPEQVRRMEQGMVGN